MFDCATLKMESHTVLRTLDTFEFPHFFHIKCGICSVFGYTIALGLFDVKITLNISKQNPMPEVKHGGICQGGESRNTF